MKVMDERFLTDTPFAAVDLDVLEKNIQCMAKYAKRADVKLRPHTKTHKSPEIAKLQNEGESSGITVAKLGEAEVMAANGLDDILIAFPIIGETKLNRFKALHEKADLKVSLDDIEAAKGLDQVGSESGKPVSVYIDIDTGLERMGRSPTESIKMIKTIHQLPHVEIIGLMSQTGQAYGAKNDDEIKQIAIEDATALQETKDLLQKEGIFVDEISIGATATARFIQYIPYVTEMRPGMYVFNDRYVMGAGGAEEKDCALSFFATVVSYPSKNRMIIDAGSKTLASDLFKGGGYGYIRGHHNLKIEKLSEEHGIIHIGEETNLQVGDVIEIIPNHVCPTVNLNDQLFGFRKGNFEKTISVLGRGKNR